MSERTNCLPWISLFGSIFCTAVAASQAGFPVQVRAASFFTIFIGAFFSAAAFVDARTYWAPDELVLPCCVLAGSFRNSGSGEFWWLWGPLSGLALWGLGRLAWRIQTAFGLRVLPPPDLVAIAMPLLLFGFNLRSAMAYMGCAAALLGIEVFRSKICQAFGSRNPDFRFRNSGCRIVPFLGIAFPVNMIAVLLP